MFSPSLLHRSYSAVIIMFPMEKKYTNEDDVASGIIQLYIFLIFFSSIPVHLCVKFSGASITFYYYYFIHSLPMLMPLIPFGSVCFNFQPRFRVSVFAGSSLNFMIGTFSPFVFTVFTIISKNHCIFIVQWL